MNKNQFGKKMKEKFQSKRKNDGIYYTGIKLEEKYPGVLGVLRV